MTITVLDPTAPDTAEQTTLNARPQDWAGLRVGLLDNGKPNSDGFLDALSVLLAQRGVAEFTRLRKGNIGRLAEPAILDQLAADCDVVITGVGDCAGCCSCTTHDGISLERRGIPTYIVCTTEFLTTARIAARTAGAPDYPFTVVDHPLGSLTPDLLVGRAAVAASQMP